MGKKKQLFGIFQGTAVVRCGERIYVISDVKILQDVVYQINIGRFFTELFKISGGSATF